jgi:hypothetical protein
MIQPKAVAFALFAASFFGASLLSAEVDFASLINTQQLLHVNAYTNGETDGSYHVGLTTGYLNTDTADLFNMFCVDFAGTIYPPTSYEITVRSLDSSLYVGPNELGLTLQQLQTMAILGSQFDGVQSDDVPLQHDIWSFTAPANTFTTDAQLTAAESAVGTTDFSNAYLLDVTVTGPNNQQQAFEAIVNGTLNGGASPVPEPGTLILVGAGLLSLGFARRRRA